MALVGKELTEYKDLPYQGFRANQPNVLSGEEVIKNALKLFLFSKMGDYGRNITKGGPLIKFLGLPFNEESIFFIKTELMDSLKEYKTIAINDIVVVADTQTRAWKITILFSDNFNKFISSINFSIKAQ